MNIALARKKGSKREGNESCQTLCNCFDMSMITRVRTCKRRLDIPQTRNNDVYSEESSKSLRSYDNMCSV